MLQLSDACGRLSSYATTIRNLTSDALIDPNLTTRGHLEELKEDAKRANQVAQRSLASLEKIGRSKSEVTRHFETIRQLTVELVEASNELQWEIAEHDANYSQRREGFSASSKEDVEAVLNRILAGE